MSTSDLRGSKAQTAQPSNPRSPSPSDPHDTPQSDASLLPLPPAAPFSSSRRPPHPTRPHLPPPATTLPGPLALQNCAPGRPQILSQIVPGQIDRRSPALPWDCRRQRPPSDLLRPAADIEDVAFRRSRRLLQLVVSSASKRPLILVPSLPPVLVQTAEHHSSSWSLSTRGLIGWCCCACVGRWVLVSVCFPLERWIMDISILLLCARCFSHHFECLVMSLICV